MSNFAGNSYYNIPVVHSSRPVSLDPPDTEQDSLYAVHGAPTSRDPEAEMDPITQSGYPPNAPPGPVYLPQRTLARSYQNSSARDLRGHARSPRNLVVVIPPPDFPLNQSQLGNVLSMGPRHRLSQGILMPLFPTMYGQLSSIAREFNFPSIVGICLYFHIAENGVTMAPRISDDSWNHLWGHLFEPHSPVRGQQPPIGGSIEFDIDLDKARWFDAWVSGAFRELPGSRARSPLTNNWQGDSQTDYPDELPADEGLWKNIGPRMLPTDSRPSSLRHPPRKPPLEERFESQALQSGMKYQHVPDSPPLTQTTGVSLTIPQATVPPTTKAELELLVTSWRANAQLDPASMVDSYQPTPDVSTAVTTAVMDEYAVEHDVPVNLTDYSYSFTSAAPSSLSGFTTPSSHLPVAISPTGGDPSDDDGWTPPDQLLSPEPLQRASKGMDFMPTTSSIWGESFGWRSATTWHKVYPYSVRQSEPITQVLLQSPGGLLPQYPNLKTYPDAYPSLTIYPHAIRDAPEPSGALQPTWGRSFAPPSVSIQLHGLGRLPPHYPHLSIYPTVYPHLDIYPTCINNGNASQPAILAPGELVARRSELMTRPTHPQLGSWPLATEVNEKMSLLSPVNVRLSMSGSISFYPNIVIYPAVYPMSRLEWPSAAKFTDDNAAITTNNQLRNAGGLLPWYPNLTIYPSTYPYIEIYPAEELRKTMVSNAVWGASFGWQKATTWLKVWPLHAANKRMAEREGGHYACGPTAVWGSSFGWDRARTWHKVYPLSYTQKVQPSISLVWEYPDLVIYPPVNSSYSGGPIACGSQAVWGSSFGWEKATTWRMVWPILVESDQPRIVPISVPLLKRGDLSSKYPDLVIYPAAYPHFDIYPAVAIHPELNAPEGSVIQAHPPSDFVSCYPDLVIYPAVYPHFDLYRPLNAMLPLKALEESLPSLRHRHIETWRARTSAQIDVAAILANNHYWEADERTELNLTDYAWSITSAGPPSPPLESPSSAYRPPSIHIDRRLEGSVILTPTTATSWGPPDHDWHPEVSTEHLPIPDLGQQMSDGDETCVRSHDPWGIGWPASHAEKKAITVQFSREYSVYPHLVIYPTAYPYFDLYPAWMKPSLQGCESTGPFLRNRVPDIYPTVYIHSNLYSSADIHVKARTQEVLHLPPVRVIFSPVYPAFDLYPSCYPHNLDCIYPNVVVAEGKKSVDLPCSYPWLVIYRPVYPFVTPYPTLAAEISQPLWPLRYSYDAPTLKSVVVKLSPQYPAFDLYPDIYPWNLTNIYPSVTIDNRLNMSVRLSSRYPWIDIYPSVYPYVQAYPHIAGAGGQSDMWGPSRLDNSERFLRSLTVTELQGKRPEPVTLHHRYPAISPYQTAYPQFDLYPIPLTVEHPHTKTDSRALSGIGISRDPPTKAMSRKRKTHAELHASVSRSLEKQPARAKKSHLQLHNAVFKDGVTGYMQDLAHLTEKRHGETPRGAQGHYRPHQGPLDRHPQRSRSATVTTSSPDRIVFPLGQPPVMPPIPPLRVRSPGAPSQPSPAVSESPVPRNPSTTGPNAPTRTPGSRLSQVVKSIIPGAHRRNSSAALRSPASHAHKDQSGSKDRQAPMRFLSFSRRNAAVPPLPNSSSDFLSRPTPTP
ncbi:hypothetical protein F5I97DRAFT_2011018 [Phlebopus sp. FC_14]|nr:hypothetical protein F5I97DRAFT_2011018 [Phlebopus sp. FC_14]